MNWKMFGVICVSLVSVILLQAENPEKQEKVTLDREKMARMENLSESLANFLLEFSGKFAHGEASELLSYFEDLVELRLIQDSANRRQERIRWIEYSHVELQKGKVYPVGKKELLHSLERFQGRISEIEDARFKIKDSRFETAGSRFRGDCKIKFFLVGRDPAGKRLWIKGNGHLNAVGGLQDGWKIQKLELDEVDLYRSDVDLFSEISWPTGTNLELPRYGSKGNDDFVYHGAAAAPVDGRCRNWRDSIPGSGIETSD